MDTTLKVIEGDQVIELSATETERRLFLAAIVVAMSPAPKNIKTTEYRLLEVSDRVVNSHRRYLSCTPGQKTIDWAEIGRFLAPFQQTLHELLYIFSDHLKADRWETVEGAIRALAALKGIGLD